MESAKITNFYFCIAIGAAIGACIRFFLNNKIGILQSGFPLSTFIVNIIGSFLIGFIVHYFSYKLAVPIFIQAGITIGFLGGLTTFSAYALEIFMLLEKKQWQIGIMYLMLSNIFCVIAVYLGLVCGRKIY